MKSFNYFKALFLAIIYSLVSILIHNYAYGTGDQAVHIPLIQKTVNPSLYQKDLLFTAGQQNLSLFYPVMAGLTKLTVVNIEYLFFLGYFIFNTLFYFVIILFARKFVGKELWLIVIFVSLFFYPYYIGGAAIQSLEISFVPRWITFVISLWGFYWLLSKKYLLVSLISPLIFAIHPISFLYFSFIVFLYLLRNNPINFKYYSVFTLSFLILNFPLIKRISNLLVIPNFSRMNPQWLEILRERNFYSFLDLWSYREWLSLIVIILPVFIYLILNRNKNKNLDNFVKSVFLACLILTFIQYVFSNIFPTIFVIRLQLARVWVFAHFVSMMSIILILKTYSLFLIKIRTYLFGLLMVIFLITFLSKQKIYLRQNESWRALQLWVNENTNEQCIFLNPVNHQGFRVYAIRPVVFEYKDGTLSFYSWEFARNWNEIRNDLKNWTELSVDNLNKLQQKYHYSYLITENNISFPLEYIYKDLVYTIYKMPKIEENCYLNND